MDESDLSRRSEAPVKLFSAGGSHSGLPCATAQAPRPGLSPLPTTPPGRYRHYKGNEYEVIGVARHSETLEPLVIYRPLYNATGLWARPHAMFFETVTIDGVVQPRFTPVSAAT